MKGRRAFTFIELVIAIAIFSIIAVSIYSTFSAGFNIWRKSNPIIEQNQARRAFFNIISGDLKSAFLYSAPAPEGTVEVTPNFEGSAAGLSFWTLVRSEDRMSGFDLARVLYYFDGEKKRVVRAIAGKAEGFNEALARISDLLDAVEEGDLHIRYCYKGPSDTEKYLWQDGWNDTNSIPRGIKVKYGDMEETIFIPTGKLGVVR